MLPRRAALGLCLLAGLGVSACTGPTTGGQATTAVTAALEQAGSAVETSDLTVSLLDEQRLTPPVADASLLDQVRVIEDASGALATLVPPADLGAARSTAMQAVGSAGTAVAAARAWVAGEPGAAGPASAAEVLEMLEDAGDQLDAVLAEVES